MLQFGLVRRKVKLPLRPKWVVITVQKRPANVLPEDAAVFILRAIVLSDARRQVVVAAVRANSHDACNFMGMLTFLKQDVDAIEWNEPLVVREGIDVLACKQSVQLAANVTHTGLPRN
jgi:hypothetical protein